MTLTIKDRLMLLGVLPREGNIATLKIVHDLRSALSFSEAEHSALGITVEGDQIKWDPTAAQTAEIEIGPKASVLISESLKKLSDDSKLTEDFLPLCEKFEVA